MALLSAAQRTQIYNELAAATSETTAEVIMQSVLDLPWGNLVTTDHLDARLAHVDARFEQVEARFEQVEARFAQVDARFAEMGERFAQTDAKIERTARNMTIWLMSSTFAFNGLLAAWLTALR